MGPALSLPRQLSRGQAGCLRSEKESVVDVQTSGGCTDEFLEDDLLERNETMGHVQMIKRLVNMLGYVNLS